MCLAAPQDPSYPVYVDSSVMMGMTGEYKEGSGFEGVQYMVCRPENDFFPDLSKVRTMHVWGYACVGGDLSKVRMMHVGRGVL